jgi:hypothetical protein
VFTGPENGGKCFREGIFNQMQSYIIWEEGGVRSTQMSYLLIEALDRAQDEIKHGRYIVGEQPLQIRNATRQPIDHGGRHLIHRFPLGCG